MQTPQISMLLDGQRLHFHHGPIDLIVDATGPGRDLGLRRAADRFDSVLSELASELHALRRPVEDCHPLRGKVASAMQRAAAAHQPGFVTPMAAVAGAVADEILHQICAAGDIRRAYVNNGGDIALHLTSTETFAAAIATGPAPRITLTFDSPVRGIATSGWRGRSHSLGIADSVTVLATTAAQADVAATLIANAVDLPGHPAIRRARACDLAPDSDLGARLVTVDVDALSPEDVASALDAGARYAARCLSRGHIIAAYLRLGETYRVIGAPEHLTQPEKDRLHA
ncbi:UPF0280 family protein [Sedimentitalea todarodis]|uniref:UPF0280 family protein n=1 Tax=Sedimentitalea todarodis TaxID=1631240 RepID=A0ABU3V858_9RHOB|nr:UPF0280 family protein [Sedimentitalea todarodis]MDU9002366.1 UPF0280 family protein [Sedimentitalea todarodis]